MSQNTTLFVVFALFGMLVTGALGALIADYKGRQVSEGFIVGLILGGIGLLILALSSSNFTRCPWCAAKIRRVASICPYCRHGLRGN